MYMEIIHRFNRKVSGWDAFSYKQNLPIQNRSGSQSSCGAIFTLLYYILVLAVLIYFFTVSLVKRNTPNFTAIEKDVSSENFTLVKNSTDLTPDPAFFSMLIYDDFCVEYGEDSVAMDKDCLSAFSFGNINIVTEITSNDLIPFVEYEWLTLSEFLTDCPDDYFAQPHLQEYIEHFLEQEENMGYNVDLQFFKNMVFCYTSPVDIVFTTEATFSVGYNLYFDPAFVFDEVYYDKLMEGELSADVEFENEVNLITQQYHGPDLTSLYQKDYYIDKLVEEHKQTLSGVYQLYGRKILIRNLFNQRIMNLESELTIGQPFVKTIKVVDLYLYEKPDGSFVLNSGSFFSSRVQLKNRVVTSNYGSGYFWRSSTSWYITNIESVEKIETSNYIPNIGYEVFSFKLMGKHDEFDLKYSGFLDVFSDVGGVLALITYLTIFVYSYNRFSMLLTYYNNFKKKAIISKYSKQQKLILNNFGNYIIYTLYQCFGFILRRLYPKSKYNINLNSFEEELFERIDIGKIAETTQGFEYLARVQLPKDKFEFLKKASATFDTFEPKYSIKTNKIASSDSENHEINFKDSIISKITDKSSLGFEVIDIENSEQTAQLYNYYKFQ